MADRFPYFRFFPERFMAGIRGLNANEVKVYICLLCRIYESGGPIRRNDVVLSTYCEMRPSSFAKALSRLLALEKFRERDGLLSNAAADEEISWRASKSQKSARAGKVSAEKRQQTQTDPATDVQRTSTNREEDKEQDFSPNGEKARKRASRLPEDWVLPMEWGRWAVEEGWPEAIIRDQSERFRDHWHAASGQTASKRDWFATWRNWMRRVPKQEKPNGKRGGQSANRDFWRAFDEATARDGGGGTQGADDGGSEAFGGSPCDGDGGAVVPLLRSGGR